MTITPSAVRCSTLGHLTDLHAQPATSSQKQRVGERKQHDRKCPVNAHVVEKCRRQRVKQIIEKDLDIAQTKTKNRNQNKTLRGIEPLTHEWNHSVEQCSTFPPMRWIDVS